MATWKKMAEAFGRAFRRIDDPTTVKSMGEVYAPAYELDYKTGEPLLDKPATDVRAAFTKGYEDAADVDRDYLSLSKGSRTPEVRDRMHESADEVRTDEALERNRQNEWDDAFKSAKARVKRGYGDSYPEDMADEGADTFEKQLLNVIDELKAQGRSVEDILDALKSMGQK